MKMYIMVMVMLILISNVLLAHSAQHVVAGNTDTIITLKECKQISVKVTGTEPIIPGEYELLECTEQQTDHWFCDCTNDYQLRLTTLINAYNTYTFNIDYNYTRPAQARSTGSSGGGYYSTFTIPFSFNNTSINNTSINDTSINDTSINDTIKNDSLNNYVTQTLIDENDTSINDTSINDTINDVSINDTIFHQSNLTNTTANNDTQQDIDPEEITWTRAVVGWFFNLINKFKWW